MTDIEEIRQRLAPVAAIDWTAVKRDRDEEYFGDWVHVGPVTMHDIYPEEEEHQHWRDATRAAKGQLEATVEFLRHAALDITALLDEIDRLRGLLAERGVEL